MNKRYLFVLLAAVFITGVLAWKYVPAVKYFNKRQQLKAEIERMQRIVEESGIPYSWVIPTKDGDPKILAGSNVTTDTLVKRVLVFSTLDTPGEITQAYRLLGQQEGWVLEQQKIVASGEQMMVFNTKQFGTLTVYVSAASSGSTVRLERLMIP